ncbi:hypothetical protein [Glutamicibacter ardleyensis]|uniref:hypothetical protein n=1 Tax=Glutamicibacter ardleyensis TaxID=225894 RepID=UPI003FD6AD4A
MNTISVEGLIQRLTSSASAHHEQVKPCVLPKQELTQMLGLDVSQTDGLPFHQWSEVNKSLAEVSSWEAFKPLVNGNWVFWDTEAITSEILTSLLSNDELKNLSTSVATTTRNHVRISDETSHSGNWEHVEHIKKTHKAYSISDVSVSVVILLHNTLGEHTLKNGVAPLTYKQLSGMTGLTLRHIGRAVKVLELAGLWTCIRGGKIGRSGTRFISLTSTQGYQLAHQILMKP